MIRKESDGYHIYSHDGKKHLGGPYSKTKAEDRLKQIEMFKHIKENVMAESNGYIAFYKGNKIEVNADTSYKAQLKATEEFKKKYPKIKSYDVTVKLAEVDGKQVTTHSESNVSKVLSILEGAETVTIEKADGEYRVPAKDGYENGAYYTDDKQDAINTAKKIFQDHVILKFRTIGGGFVGGKYEKYKPKNEGLDEAFSAESFNSHDTKVIDHIIKAQKVLGIPEGGKDNFKDKSSLAMLSKSERKNYLDKLESRIEKEKVKGYTPIHLS